MSTLAAGTSFGPYAIEGFIAGGGMGRVYAAAHEIYGNPVALKVLHARFAQDPRWQQRFSQEGLVGTRLKHPHVLSARELVNHENQVALVMDLVSGGQTLLKVIDREFPSGLELSEALSVFLQILSGVEYLHDRDIIHGDLKPENVLVSGNLRNPSSWIPQVTDFGTVALIADPVQLDGKSAIVASPRYASPEHMLGIDKVNASSDIYSMGLILHYLLTGQHISTARTVPEAKAQLALEVPLVHLVDQPEGVIQVVQRATSTAPDDRYEDCRALALAIRDRLDDMGLGIELE
ncbi:MAG: serine/threonine protein kinase, partial [Kiritimatiellia bacterium]